MSLRTHWTWLVVATVVIAIAVGLLSGASREVNAALFFAAIAAAVVGSLKGKRP